MTLEDEFEKWWAGSSAESYPDTKEAFLYAYRLGLTRAAEIAQNEFNKSWNEPVSLVPNYIVSAILTERDKSSKS